MGGVRHLGTKKSAENLGIGGQTNSREHAGQFHWLEARSRVRTDCTFGLYSLTGRD